MVKLLLSFVVRFAVGQSLGDLWVEIRFRSKRGFTLLELIVVLSIITILATLGMVGYQASAPPGAVDAARNTLHGLLRFARQQAILSGSNAMLIINYDKDDREKFLRYAGVIVEEEYDSTIWKAAHGGIYLPEGVYFVPQTVDAATDRFDFDGTWTNLGGNGDRRSQYECENDKSKESAIGLIEYPVLSTITPDPGTKTGGERKWIGYQFGPDGRVKGVDFKIACSASPGGGSQSNHIALGLASYQTSSALRFRDSEKVVGVMIRLNGVSYAVDDPDEL